MDKKAEEFVRLLTPLKKSLSGFIRYLLWNKQDFEDALQNVLTEAYRKFDQFMPGTNFKNWIFHVASFTVFNMNRKYERDKQVILSEEIEQPAPDSLYENTDYQDLLTKDDMVLEKMSDEVKASLNLLTEIERAVFLLRSLGDESYAEIAETLKIPGGSVMAYLSRARVKLRKHLIDHAKEGGYV